MKKYVLASIYSLLFLLIFSTCQTKSEETSVVVIYTSVDQPFSEPILSVFEQETGIKIRPVYDVEATKTTGLVNRLIAEKNNPLADVFWNGEFAQTILLKNEGVLATYRSPNTVDIPDQYRDSDGYWTGFAGRARVILVNTDLLAPEDYPDSIYDLLDEKYPAEKIGIASPLFGTTATHAAAIYTQIGTINARDYFISISSRGIQVVDGNSVVRDMVANGQLMFGLTDTDDACTAVEKGKPVKIIFPDQGLGQSGTLIIPNTVALIAGAPHPENAKIFIDYLLSPETENTLLESGWSHISLRKVDAGPSCIETKNIQGMEIGLTEIYHQFTLVKHELTEIFVR